MEDAIVGAVWRGEKRLQPHKIQRVSHVLWPRGIEQNRKGNLGQSFLHGTVALKAATIKLMNCNLCKILHKW